MFFLSVILLGNLSYAECEHPGIKIQGATDFELQSSCESLNKVTSLFSSTGLNIEPQFQLFYEEQTKVKIGEDVYPVYGYFDDETFEMHITSFENSSQNEQTPWGLSWSKALGASYVLHEMTHLVAATELARNKIKLKREWHELIAYSVQIELMDASIREKILSRYTTIASYANPESVDISLYELDPETFAIKAYKSFKAWGGASFLKSVLEGQVPSTIKPQENL